MAADLLLVTHEHSDHNATDRIAGDPPVLRSTAGRLESAIGEVLAVASEHDAAIGTVDLAFLPVGGGPTVGGEQAAAIAERIGARWVVPMHYRTQRIDFLSGADDFLARMPEVHRPGATAFDTDDLPATDALVAVVPDAP